MGKLVGSAAGPVDRIAREHSALRINICLLDNLYPPADGRAFRCGFRQSNG
jgi:hypothetical protein